MRSIKTIKTVLLIAILALPTLAFLPVFSTEVNNLIKANNFVIPTVCWDKKLQSAANNGQVLCVNEKTLGSRVINGKIVPSTIEGGYCPNYINIKGCNANEKAIFYNFNRTKKLFNNKPVSTVIVNDSNGFDSKNFKLAGQSYNLKHKILTKYKGQKTLFNITLCKSNVCQEIVQKKCDDPYEAGGNATVIWAGDIDNDKKLDLLLAYNAEQYTRNITLFLSSYAQIGKFVEPVAKNTLISD